jgi:hypothetical protein
MKQAIFGEKESGEAIQESGEAIQQSGEAIQESGEAIQQSRPSEKDAGVLGKESFLREKLSGFINRAASRSCRSIEIETLSSPHSTSLSEILCARHNMSAVTRSLYAKQNKQEEAISGAARYSERTH